MYGIEDVLNSVCHHVIIFALYRHQYSGLMPALMPMENKIDGIFIFLYRWGWWKDCCTCKKLHQCRSSLFIYVWLHPHWVVDENENILYKWLHLNHWNYDNDKMLMESQKQRGCRIWKNLFLKLTFLCLCLLCLI